MTAILNIDGTYAIYTEVILPTPNGGTAKVLQLVGNFDLYSLQDQIATLQQQIADKQVFVDVINSIPKS